MSKETLNQFTNQLSTYIQSQQQIAYPKIGTITYASSNYEYCTVKTEQGTFTQIPAHGMPIVGDTAIIHFINGNYEQPVADCARKLPCPDDVITDYQLSDCYNYLDNGDFTLDKSKATSMTGTYTLQDDASYTEMSTNCCKLEQENDYISITCDISECAKDYFKFQCYYRGQGSLKIECRDTDTGNIIQTLPYNMRYDYKVWQTQNSRWQWVYNKEVYPFKENNTTHKNIMITITNNSSKVEHYAMGSVVKTTPVMLVDGLLVYDENSDKNYYSSANDVLNNKSSN